MQQTVKDLITNRLISSAHDCADGGLYITLLESAMPQGLGFDIAADAEIRKDAFLFGEAQGRVVVSVSDDKLTDFEKIMQASTTQFSRIGAVTAGDILIDDADFGKTKEQKQNFESALKNIIEG